MIKFKYIIVLIVLASIGSIVYGFSLKPSLPEQSDKFIGFGTIGLFLVAMPLFLIKESKGKKMQDYMLTKENIDKMKIKDRETPKNR
jgi:uncharacterized membrane protein